ncbi:DUF1150 family protein [Tepidamorphus sp. 3E244]|uniref:BQ00720 family protein n=1 Tax=Tepidamorphus sp. 3E244 TaxID=3385498 RepID=UPI0038FC15ED
MTDEKTHIQTASELPDNALLAEFGTGELAYIRKVSAGDLAESVPEVRDLPPETPLFALHGASGDPILLATSRAQAVASASEHELTTLSLH